MACFFYCLGASRLNIAERVMLSGNSPAKVDDVKPAVIRVF
jgi:hypothetical protein